MLLRYRGRNSSVLLRAFRKCGRASSRDGHEHKHPGDRRGTEGAGRDAGERICEPIRTAPSGSYLSELQVHTKLENARLVARNLACNLAERRAAELGVGISEVRMIGNIQRFKAELQDEPLADLEILEQ